MKKNNNAYKMFQNILHRTHNINQENILSIMEEAKDLENIIDEKFTEFQKQGVNIDVYMEYFENMISEHTTKLLTKLETEHAKNMCIINDLFRSRISSKIELEKFLNRVEIEISETEAEYKSLKKIVDDMDPLKNGTLRAGKTVKMPKEGEGDA